MNFVFRTYLVLLLTIAALMIPESAFSLSPLTVDDDVNLYNIGMSLDILEDKSGKLTIEDVTSEKYDPLFKSSSSPVPNLGFQSYVYWARFRLENKTGKEICKVLDIGTPNLNDIRMYIPDTDKFKAVWQSGKVAGLPYDKVFNTNFAASINIPAESSITFYIRASSKTSLNLPISILNKSDFTMGISKAQFRYGLYYGFMLIMVLYNLFIYFSSRNLNFLYFSLSLFFMHVLTPFSITGHYFQVIPYNSFPYLEEIKHCFFSLSIVSFVFLTRSFLDTKENTPKLHRINTLIIILSLCFIPLAFIVSYTSLTKSTSVIFPIFLCIIWYTALRCMTAGNKAARFYLLGCTIFLPFATIFSLKSLGILPVNYITEHSLIAGLSFHALFLSFALLDLINIMRTEKEAALQSMQKSQQKYFGIFENIQDVYGEIDLSGRIIEVSPSIKNIIGYTREELIGSYVDEATDNTNEISNFTRLFSDRREVFDHEIPLVDKTGEVQFCSVNAKLMFDSNGTPNKVIVSLRNITPSKQTKQELLVSEKKYHDIFKNIQDVYFETNIEGTILEVSPSSKKILHYKRENLIGKSLFSFMTDNSEEKRFKQTLLTNGKIEEFELRLKNPVFGEGYFSINAKVFSDEEILFLNRDEGRIQESISEVHGKTFGGKPVKIIGSLRNISDRKSIEEELIEYQTRLRSLTAELLLSEEQQRRKIAIDIHDRIGHALANVKIKLGILKKLRNQPAQPPVFDDIHSILDQTIKDTQSLTFEISPHILYDLGLEAAIEWLMEQTQKEHGIMMWFSDDMSDKPLDNSVRILLFQATRELLFNIIKHAGASSTKVSIRRDKDNIRIDIEDDGVGFDTSKTHKSLNKKGGGFGLFSIRERLSHLGGFLEIHSSPGSGSKISIVSPLELQRENAA